jgi:hypothetical protein
MTYHALYTDSVWSHTEQDNKNLKASYKAALRPLYRQYLDGKQAATPELNEERRAVIAAMRKAMIGL